MGAVWFVNLEKQLRLVAFRNSKIRHFCTRKFENP